MISIGKFKLGSNKPVLFSGPCLAESNQLCIDVAGIMSEICKKLDFNYVFKASFEKANRTSITSPSQAVSFELLKETFKEIQQSNIPVMTDVHEEYHCFMVKDCVDVIQIPAFLCRQTKLILTASQTGKPVNIKKGQFMTPEQMRYATEKAGEKAFITERGTTFGYGDLIVDFRSLPIMRKFSPVVFDCTHSVQKPGHKQTKGERHFIPYLAKAAASAGVDGFFIETHPDPDKALSDGANMLPLNKMEDLLSIIREFWQLEYETRESMGVN